MKSSKTSFLLLFSKIWGWGGGAMLICGQRVQQNPRD